MSKPSFLRRAAGRSYVVAEIAQGHDGSLGLAHAYIDAAADAGADAVKFQTHIAAAESTRDEPWRVRFSRQDRTRLSYWKRMEFSESQWKALKRHADRRGVAFLSSPFSVEAVRLLSRLPVPAWKIASGEVANRPLLNAVCATGKPILLSTGMSGWAEIDAAVRLIRSRRRDLVLLQATSSYPCPPERWGLNVMDQLRRRYRVPVGLSDHSGTVAAGLAAAALGADVLEVHVSFHRKMFGPDVSSSITVEELRQLTDGVRMIGRALAHPVDKNAAARRLAGMRRLFTRSVALAADLPAGRVLKAGDLVLKKPGTGLPAARLASLVGRRLKRSVPADRLLKESDLTGGRR